MPINRPSADEAQVCGVADLRVENVALDFDDEARCDDDREGADLTHEFGSATYAAKADGGHSFGDAVADVSEVIGMG